MRYSKTLMLAAAASAVTAQRPANMSICDYYTTALFMQNTAANQYSLLTALVNRAVIGNTTANPSLTGIVAQSAMYMGQEVDLLQYFDGSQNSTNHGGSMGVSVNFLDGGGATPLEMGMPADDTTSNQYTLLTHLYEYFGDLLGCSQYGMSGFPSYAGFPSMFEVHKYMGLDMYEVGYFIEQVGLSALSFGVTMSDVTAVGKELTAIFDVRCGPNMTVIAAQGMQLQSICIDPNCPLAVNATCSVYPTEPMPVNVTMSSNSTSPSMSGMPSSTTTGPEMQTATGAASSLAVGSLLGALAFMLAL